MDIIHFCPLSARGHKAGLSIVYCSRVVFRHEYLAKCERSVMALLHLLCGSATGYLCWLAEGGSMLRYRRGGSSLLTSLPPQDRGCCQPGPGGVLAGRSYSRNSCRSWGGGLGGRQVTLRGVTELCEALQNITFFRTLHTA